jgi:dihydroflavonol-4-reductase
LKVLLTGASGFVGSHILDALRARNLPVAVLLRSTSSQEFLRAHLNQVELRQGSITNPESLTAALRDVTHVIHCAGCTRARNNAEFFEINQLGTRNLVEALTNLSAVQRLLHISSLAVTGPATRERPARETDPPRPISAYGKSKLAAEEEINARCRVPYTILRPPAVYGPRDNGFLPMFKAVRNHLLPKPSARQYLSLVYARDLAEATVECLLHPAAPGKIYFVSNKQTVTAQEMAKQIALQMGQWTSPCPMPAAMLWPMCFGQEIFSRVTGKPVLLNLQKYAELRAPGWVCDPSLLQKETGCECATALSTGIRATLEWYREHQWL